MKGKQQNDRTVKLCYLKVENRWKQKKRNNDITQNPKQVDNVVNICVRVWNLFFFESSFDLFFSSYLILI